jgi:hypothetical protein
VEIDFSDLMLYETFHCLRAVTLGKVHVDPSVVSYYRQLGTSITYRPSQDWVAHLLRSRFTVDAEALVDRLARATAAADGTDAAAAAAVIRPIIEDYFRVFLAGEYGWRTRVVRLLRARLPRLTRWLQSRPRFFIGRQRSALLAGLAAAGASPQSQRRTRSGLADIEQAFSHDAFAEYAAPFRDVAVSDDRRNWL